VNAINICTTFESGILAQKKHLFSNLVPFNHALFALLVIVIFFSTNTFYVNWGYRLSLTYKSQCYLAGVINIGLFTNHRNSGIDSLNDREEHYRQAYVLHGVDKRIFGILKSRFR